MATIDAYLLEKLNTQQSSAAMDCDHHSLILAWAWSGKTRTLTYKIANLIYWHWIHPQNILAVTFTNKAANEMKERIQHIMKEIKERTDSKWTETDEISTQKEDIFDFDALLDTPTDALSSPSWGLPDYQRHDYKWIGTFHSIFLKILKIDIDKIGLGYTKQFTIYDTSDIGSLMKELIKKSGMSDRVEFRVMQWTISQRKSKWYLPQQAALYCETQSDERCLELYKKYQKRLQDANALDFDDLLMLPEHLFENSPETLSKRQSQFSHILVDEAQDTNTIQFELMRKLCNDDSVITFIGDDYQSIYRWRGAMMSNFLNVNQWRPNIVTYKLETNYRSKPHIVAAWNAIIKQNKIQYDKNVEPHRTWEDLIRVFTFSDEIDEATQIVELITKVKEEQDKQRSDFTILYRTNAQSSPFEQILIAEWIPYKVVGAFKFFERAEIKDVLSYIRYLLNPRDQVALKRIINTPKRWIGKTSVDQLEEIAVQAWVSMVDVLKNIDTYSGVLKPAAVSKFKSFANMIQNFIWLVDMVAPAQLIDEIIKGIHYEQYTIKVDWKEKWQERMDNLWQLINMASKYTDVGIEQLTLFMEEVALMTNIESGDEDPNAVRLMSVHGSKWLEFPYVFIVWLEENILPLWKAKFDDAELEEERRWMYVAITRAKDHLFLSHAQSRQQRWQIKYNQPSRFLEEIPEELLKRYDMSTWWSARYAWVEKSFNEWDRVTHKLFGPGTIVEVRWNVAIIRFDNPKFKVRKMEMRYLKAE